jgi:phage terminase large subunit
MSDFDSLQKLCAHYRDDPVEMVRREFGANGDPWQIELLECYRRHRRICMKAAKGPGKSCGLAWVALHFLLTRPNCIIGVTSISGDNLKSGLWAELARWYAKSPLLQRLFEMTKSEIFARHPIFSKSWKIEARTWPKDADAAQIGNALSGLHAKHVMWLLDESGSMPDAIMPTCEGIFSGDPIEAHIIQAGNPNVLGGPLYRACTSSRSLWHVIEITGDPDNPRRSPRISIEVAREQIKQYGRDNHWVRVNIFGEFPPSSINALIGPDEVSQAMERYWREHEIGHAEKVLGVDVARFGDDQSIIAPRQGIQMFPLMKFRNLRTNEGAAQVARKWNDWQADAAFVDAGTYGAGWIDDLLALGKAPISVDFGGTPHDRRYYNKRTEMAFDLCEWIRRGGALPKDDKLLEQLCATTYTFPKHSDRMILEPKEMVKLKLQGHSPDEMDACMLTLAEPVTRASAVVRQSTRNAAAVYNPFAELERANSGAYAGDRNYDPVRP